MSQPLISVIVPVYNAESYISDALDSLVKQTYQNLEILLINDGSIDNSLEICSRYQRKDDRIQTITQQNKGAAAARNHGLRIASGEYIFFMDSDDTMHPDTILTLYHLIIKYNSMMSMINFTEVDTPIRKWENIGNIDIKESKCYSQKELMEILCSLREGISKRLLLTVPWGKLYRKDLLQGLEYPEGTICEDEFMINHIVYRCKTMGYADAQLYAYLKRAGSVMSGNYDIRKLASMKAFEARIHCAHKLGFLDCEEAMSTIFIKDHIGNYCMAYSQSCKNNEVYDWLIKSFRKNLKKYWKVLNKSLKIRSLIFYISPKLYLKVKVLLVHDIYT